MNLCFRIVSKFNQEMMSSIYMNTGKRLTVFNLAITNCNIFQAGKSELCPNFNNLQAAVLSYRSQRINARVEVNSSNYQYNHKYVLLSILIQMKQMPQNRILQGSILLSLPGQNSFQHQHFSQLVTSQNWTFKKSQNTKEVTGPSLKKLASSLNGLAIPLLYFTEWSKFQFISKTYCC